MWNCNQIADIGSTDCENRGKTPLEEFSHWVISYYDQTTSSMCAMELSVTRTSWIGFNNWRNVPCFVDNHNPALHSAIMQCSKEGPILTRTSNVIMQDADGLKGHFLLSLGNGIQIGQHVVPYLVGFNALVFEQGWWHSSDWDCQGSGCLWWHMFQRCHGMGKISNGKE